MRDLIAVTGLVILLKLDSNHWFFSPFDLEIWWMIVTYIIGHLSYTTSSFVHHFKSIGEFILELLSGNAQFGSKLAIFCPLISWNLTGDLKKLYNTSSILRQALCIVPKTPVNSNWSCSPETLNLGQNQWPKKFDGWPWKAIGHPFYAYSSNVHHLVAICAFKLELWSGKSQIGAKFALTSVTLTFDLWVWILHGHHICRW